MLHNSGMRKIGPLTPLLSSQLGHGDQQRLLDVVGLLVVARFVILHIRHLLVVSSLELVRRFLVPGNLIHPVGLVVVPCDDDRAKKSLLHFSMEAWASPGLLMDLPNLIKNSVCAKNLVTDLATHQNLLLVLPDG